MAKPSTACLKISAELANTGHQSPRVPVAGSPTGSRSRNSAWYIRRMVSSVTSARGISRRRGIRRGPNADDRHGDCAWRLSFEAFPWDVFWEDVFWEDDRAGPSERPD